MSQTLTLATRKSPLALAQSNLVEAAIRQALPDAAVVRLPMTTTGDKRLAWSLEEKGGKGLFTKELEVALLERRADLAVHSAKDLPTGMEPGLVLAGFLPRESVEDVLVKRAGIECIQTLATGSPRRRAQAKLFLPDTRFMEIRGNVGTRLDKIKDGQADATILASAGLKRLGISQWDGLEFEPLSLKQMIPAVGQGAIALQCRSGEEARFEAITDKETGVAVSIEREFLSLVGGGCQSAFAAHFTRGALLAYHEVAGRFSMAFNTLDLAEVREAIRITLEEKRP